MKNYVTLKSKGIGGYIDDSTPCGKALVERLKADLNALAKLQQDPNLTIATKRAIETDYYTAIKRYVEQEEECPHCPCSSTPCDHRYYKGLTNELPHKEEPCEEEDWCDCDWEEEEEYEEEPTVEDMKSYDIYFGENEEINCDSYAETVEKVGLLLQLNIDPQVYGYDGQGGMYRLDILDEYDGISLEIA